MYKERAAGNTDILSDHSETMEICSVFVCFTSALSKFPSGGKLFQVADWSLVCRRVSISDQTFVIRYCIV